MYEMGMGRMRPMRPRPGPDECGRAAQNRRYLPRFFPTINNPGPKGSHANSRSRENTA